MCTNMYHGHLTPPPFPPFRPCNNTPKKSPSQKTKPWMTDLIPTKRLQEREKDNHDSCQKCVCARFHNCRICLTWLELSSWHCMQISKFMSHFITEINLHNHTRERDENLQSMIDTEFLGKGSWQEIDTSLWPVISHQISTSRECYNIHRASSTLNTP